MRVFLAPGALVFIASACTGELVGVPTGADDGGGGVGDGGGVVRPDGGGGGGGGGGGDGADGGTAPTVDAAGGVVNGEPGPRPTGVHSSVTSDLPGGEVTACEWEWTVRLLHYHPKAVTPRRMYFSACNTAGASPTMFTSLTVGDNAAHPAEDPSSGGIIQAQLNPATGALSPTRRAYFPECISMHGIATSSDCSTVAALCRIPSGTSGFDKDVLATHRDADWMTQPYVCGDRGKNDEMWLYEWTDGDITAEPKKYIVHKAIGSWEYGNNYLRFGEEDNTYAIAVKATVGGSDGSGSCHEADAFLIMDRSSNTMTNRGWSWACGTGHTTFNRPAYNPATQKYAMMCSTDYNEEKVGGLGAYVFHMEDGGQQEFHYLNLDGIRNKGGASALLPRPDGGYLGVLVGVNGSVSPDGVPRTPPTAIGLAQWGPDGAMDGGINWVRKNSGAYLSYSNLAVLGPNRYLLGWGEMLRLDDTNGSANESLRVPWDYYVMEIDGSGRALTEPLRLDGAGWGEQDQMVSLGRGRVGWSYIEDPTLNSDYNAPSCNQDALQMTVYTSETE